VWCVWHRTSSAALYDVFEATGSFPEPEWPRISPLQKILKIAFREQYIDTLEIIPVLRSFAGGNLMGLDIELVRKYLARKISNSSAPPGEVPTPICLVAQEFRSGKNIRIWEDKLHELKAPHTR